MKDKIISEKEFVKNMKQIIAVILEQKELDSTKLLKFILAQHVEEIENYEHFREHGKHKEE